MPFRPPGAGRALLLPSHTNPLLSKENALHVKESSFDLLPGMKRAARFRREWARRS
jgi:hypothetical protein